MTVSIIIAVKTWQKNLEDCVNKCCELDCSDYEIIILPDEPFNVSTGPVCKVIPTGSVSAPQKRDIGIRHCRGQFVAFLDDDAYPPKNWLKAALHNFKDGEVAAVGGPSITPPEDDALQKASGLVYSSVLVSAHASMRYVPKERKEAVDLPSCNLLVRKDTLDAIGGFDADYWPGEDTKLCLEIIKRKKKIIYDPRVFVYHHRRRVFASHLKQVSNYALHRGYFAKKFPATSRKISYCIPSIFVIGMVSALLILPVFPALTVWYLAGATAYLIIILINSIINVLRSNYREKPRLIFLTFLGIIMTHFVYGIYFIKGILLPKLKEE